MSPAVVLIIADHVVPATTERVVALAQLLHASATVVASVEDALIELGASTFDLVILPGHSRDVDSDEVAAHLERLCREQALDCPPVWLLDGSEFSRGQAQMQSVTPALDLATLDTLEADIGDREFVRETIEVYLQELPDRVERIAAGLAAQRPDEVKSVAHSLKSSSAMLGALRLAEFCAELEKTSVTPTGIGDWTPAAQRIRAEAAQAELALRARLLE